MEVNFKHTFRVLASALLKTLCFLRAAQNRGDRAIRTIRSSRFSSKFSFLISDSKSEDAIFLVKMCVSLGWKMTFILLIGEVHGNNYSPNTIIHKYICCSRYLGLQDLNLEIYMVF